MAVRVARCDAAFTEARNQAEALRRERARIEAEQKALESMQSRLGVQERSQGLIRKHGLSDLPVFWQGIQVTSGWELAVEATLGARLNAYGSEDYSKVGQWARDEIPAGVGLFLPGSAEAGAGAPDLSALASHPRPLRERVTVRAARCEAALEDWLQGVYAVEDFAAALSDARHLPPGVVLVSREGHLIERHSVLFFAPQGEVHGALARAREIEGHQQTLEQLQRQGAVLDAQREAAESFLAACRAEQTRAEGEARAAETARHALEVERTRLQGLLERHQQRARQVAEEKIELDAQHGAEQARLQDHQQLLVHAEQEFHAATAELVALEQAWREAERDRDARRSALQSAERAAQEAGFLEKSARERMGHLAHARHAAETRLAQREPRLHTLQQELAQALEAPLNEQLQRVVGQRAACEQHLGAARAALDALAATLHELEAQRLAAQQRQEPLRVRLNELGLKEQEARLNLERAEESLQANHANEAELAEMLEKGVRTHTLQAEIGSLTARIEALGAVNLAALAELETARARRAWLDAQVADLLAAVETLESAMRKIDRETREQLKDTFDRVNASFSTLFPSLFGGGHARIELTGEEILDAGVQIIAQPPGKKTTSIHLLSGGEKALTALSLVFSLFQLNPAPFCLLDEVDAPLDDANTERFVRRVQKMSEQTQFLFITHNKIAMEMAHQLVGITMAESGVSRMVAVDIEEAMRLTEAVAV